MIRTMVGTAVAALCRVRYGKRVRASSFLVAAPSRVRISRSARVEIGKGVVIEKGARIVVRGELTIGEGVYIGKNATIVSFSSVSIGARTLIGENVSIHDEDHGPAGHRGDFMVSPVTVGEDSWLCAGVVVTRGVSIGSRTTIAANAVVTDSVPDDCLAGGLPARVIRLLQATERAAS